MEKGGGVQLFGLGAVWLLIDWIIALTKFGKYEKDFVFDYNGKWSQGNAKGVGAVTDAFCVNKPAEVNFSYAPGDV